MKWKLVGIGMATMLTLVACGDNGNDEGNSNNGDDINTEQTRYNNNADDMNNGQPLRNVQNDDDDRINNDNNNNENRYDVAEKAADKITDQIKEIDNAYVLTTDNNAYVAAELDTNDDDNNNDNKNNNNNNNTNGNDNGDELTDEVKQKISDIVKSVDADIDNVYVSTNPDFVDLTNNYANDAGNGEPVEGFFDQIGNMIERIFPQDKE